MASVIEQILVAAADGLIAAGLADGRVERGRTDAWGEDELPGINIRRGASESRTLGQRLEQTTLSFEVEHLVADVVGWESAGDALHLASHPILFGNAQIASLARGFICTGTEAVGASADFTCGKLIARYQLTFVTRPGDLTRAVS